MLKAIKNEKNPLFLTNMGYMIIMFLSLGAGVVFTLLGNQEWANRSGVIFGVSFGVLILNVIVFVAMQMIFQKDEFDKDSKD